MRVTPITSKVSTLSNAQTPQRATDPGRAFGDLLAGQIERITQTQERSDRLTQDLITGQTEDLHEVMVAAEEARITLEMSLQIRNKIIEAYKEITNMQL